MFQGEQLLLFTVPRTMPHSRAMPAVVRWRDEQLDQVQRGFVRKLERGAYAKIHNGNKLNYFSQSTPTPTHCLLEEIRLNF